MGRAIDMENDIQVLKAELDKLKNTVRGMVSKIDDLEEDMDEIYEGSSKTKHVDLVEEVGAKTEKKNDKKEDKKADNKGDGKSNKSANKGSGKPKNENK